MQIFLKIRVDGVVESKELKDIEKGLKWVLIGVKELQYQGSQFTTKESVLLKSKIDLDKSEFGKVLTLLVSVHPYKLDGDKYAKISYHVLGERSSFLVPFFKFWKLLLKIDELIFPRLPKKGESGFIVIRHLESF
jgi:hypothetical protein